MFDKFQLPPTQYVWTSKFIWCFFSMLFKATDWSNNNRKNNNLIVCV